MEMEKGDSHPPLAVGLQIVQRAASRVNARRSPLCVVMFPEAETFSVRLHKYCPPHLAAVTVY